jgi:hypothetical protein
MGTTLAFRTPSGAVDVPVGKTKELGTVNVHPFERIRVVADERGGSAGPVVIRLTITEGDELVGAARHVDPPAQHRANPGVRGTEIDCVRRCARRCVGNVVCRCTDLRLCA